MEKKNPHEFSLEGLYLELLSQSSGSHLIEKKHILPIILILVLRYEISINLEKCSLSIKTKLRANQHDTDPIIDINVW